MHTLSFHPEPLAHENLDHSPNAFSMTLSKKIFSPPLSGTPIIVYK
jgi:hypothetical protein